MNRGCDPKDPLLPEINPKINKTMERVMFSLKNKNLKGFNPPVPRPSNSEKPFWPYLFLLSAISGEEMGLDKKKQNAENKR